MNYGLEVTKLVAILKDSNKLEEEKLVAEKRLREIRYIVTKDRYGVPEDRVEDVMELERTIDDPLTPEHYRKLAKESLKKIVNETSAIRSMRKSLVREMKAGRTGNVLDINDYVNKHSKYKNE